MPFGSWIGRMLWYHISFHIDHVKGLCCSPEWIWYKSSVCCLVNTITFVGCSSPSSALLISLHQELRRGERERERLGHGAGQQWYSVPEVSRSADYLIASHLKKSLLLSLSRSGEKAK